MKSLEKTKKAIVYGAIVGSGFVVGQAGAKLDQKLNERSSEKKKFESGEVAFQDYVKEMGNSAKVSSESIPLELTNQKEWMQRTLDNPSYKGRATFFEGVSQEKINARVERLNQTPVFFLDKENLENKDNQVNPDYSNIKYTTLGKNTNFDNGKSVITIAAKAGTLDHETVVVHEFQHATTKGEAEISEYAKQLYKKAFISPEDSSFVKNEKYINPLIPSYATDVTHLNQHDQEAVLKHSSYLSNPTELDARKKQLEYDLERLGIKKYGEPTNDQVIQKMLKAVSLGKLSQGSKDFLFHIKPEYFKQVMNTIASNEYPPQESPDETIQA